MSKRVDDIYDEVVSLFQFGNFLNTTMMMDAKRRRYVPIDTTTVTKLIQRNSKVSPRPAKKECAEVFTLIESLSEDLGAHKHLILFGDDYATQKVWNMKTANWEPVPKDVSHIVWRSSIYPTDDKSHTKPAHDFLLQVANGDARHAQDILQACAPLLLMTKPLGVIWFSGIGRNGKSGVVEVLYRLLGDYLTKVTLHQIQDGKMTPILNGKLGNIVPESSEGYIDDSEKYKVIGEHGVFNVRKYHSQDAITVDTQMLHTIFNTNNIPNFADKSSGVRARTIIIPFLAKFKEDPRFFDKTFTPEFLGGFLSLLGKEASKIKHRGYVYNWGDITHAQKEDYDSEVNSAEGYLEFLRRKKCTGFTNWRVFRISYENWCADNGDMPLGVKALKATMKNSANVRTATVRDEGMVIRRWIFDKPTKREIVQSELLPSLGLWIDPTRASKLDNVTKSEQQLLLENDGLV